MIRAITRAAIWATILILLFAFFVSMWEGAWLRAVFMLLGAIAWLVVLARRPA